MTEDNVIRTPKGPPILEWTILVLAALIIVIFSTHAVEALRNLTKVCW